MPETFIVLVGHDNRGATYAVGGQFKLNDALSRNPPRGGSSFFTSYTAGYH